MVVVSEKKAFELVRFENIIKRCPICLSDTEQTAYYAKAPDLSVTVHVDTEPKYTLVVRPTLEHTYEWDVLAECSRCKYMYRVMGVPRMRVKDIPRDTSREEHELALTCCDLCYNEYYRYTISEVFIKLSSIGNVYLCKEHAQEAEQEKKREGGYTSLAARLSRWGSVKEKPILVNLEDGRQLILKSNNDLSMNILSLLSERGSATRGEINRMPWLKDSGMDAINDAVSYLKGMSLVQEALQGVIIKKEVLSLTEDGEMAAYALSRRRKR